VLLHILLCIHSDIIEEGAGQIAQLTEMKKLQVRFCMCFWAGACGGVVNGSKRGGGDVVFTKNPIIAERREIFRSLIKGSHGGGFQTQKWVNKMYLTGGVGLWPLGLWGRSDSVGPQPFSD